MSTDRKHSPEGPPPPEVCDGFENLTEHVTDGVFAIEDLQNGDAWIQTDRPVYVFD